MEVKEATDKAVNYLTNFYPEADRVKLEEVEITDDNKFWNITLSYDEPPVYQEGFLRTKPIRSYKVFKIATVDGVVRGMKIRELK